MFTRRSFKRFCCLLAFICLIVSDSLAAPVTPAPIAPPSLSLPSPALPDLPQAAPPQPPAAAAPSKSHASDGYSALADRVSRIEAAADSDPDGAAQNAEEFEIELNLERSNRSGQAAKADARADSWRELAEGSENDAARNRQRAMDARAESKQAGLSESERAEFETQAAFWDRQAVDDQKRAADRRAEVSTYVAESERHKDAIAYLDGLIARLDRVIERARQNNEERSISQNATNQTQPEPDASEDSEAADYEISLQQALGIWRPDEAQEQPLIIVSQNPEGNEPYKLQLFSRDRVWTGRFNLPSPTADDRLREPRMTFEYKPRASEMNPDIPLWAREEIEDQLVWKIDAYEIGTAVDMRLRFRFFRGRVRWNDDDKTVTVDGEGPPKTFDGGRDSILESRISAPTMLFVSLANNAHDPSLKAIDGIVRGTPLHVNVVTSAVSAREIGSNLTVNITAEGGSPSKLTLSRQRVTKDNRVVYGHEGVVTIGGDEPERDFAPYSASPRRIIGWVSSALGTGDIAPGPRLGSLPKNGGLVTFTYQNAFQSFPVYATWVQRALAQRENEINRIAATYGGILSSNASDKVKSETRLRLRMLAHLQTLNRSAALTDMHRLELAQAYLGYPNGRQLLNYGLEKLDEINVARSRDITISELDRESWLSVCGTQTADAYRAKLLPPDLRNREATSEEIGEGIERNALGALGDLDINALVAMNDSTLDWVHPLERECVERVIVGVSTNVLTASLKEYGESLMFGLYEGFAMASGADDFAVAFFETDIYGNKVPQFSLPWWISTLSMTASLVDAFDGAIDLGRKSADNNIWKAAASDGYGKTSWARALENDTAARLARNFPMTEAVGDASRTIIRRANGVTQEVPEAIDDVLGDILAPLSASQRKQTHISLIDPTDARITEKITGKPQLTDRLGQGLGNVANPAVTGTGSSPSLLDPKTGVIPWYGTDAKPMGQLTETLCQIKGEHGCEAVSASFLLAQEEGRELTEAFMHQEILKAHIERNLKQAGISPAAAEVEFTFALRNGRPMQRSGQAYEYYFNQFTQSMYGRTQGYLFDDVGYMLQKRGYEVHAINPARNGAIDVNYLSAALTQGYRIRIGIRHPTTGGGHAVIVSSVTRDKLGRLKDVVYFCPAQGGLLRMRADKFQRWIANERDYAVAYLLRKPQPIK